MGRPEVTNEDVVVTGGVDLGARGAATSPAPFPSHSVSLNMTGLLSLSPETDSRDSPNTGNVIYLYLHPAQL